MRSVLGRHIAWALAILVSAAGMRVSYQLALMHVPNESEAATGAETETKPASLWDEICTTWFENGNCEAVDQSEWSTIRLGQYAIPSANLGLFYFTAVFFWLLLIACPTPSRWWVHLLLMMVIACGLGSSVFFTIQMKKLGVWCPLCMVTHVGNLLLMILGLAMWPRAPKLATVAVTGDPSPTSGDTTGEPLEANATETTSIRQPSPAPRPWPHWWMLLVTPIVILLAIHAEGVSLSARQQKATKSQVLAEAAKLSDNELVKELEKKLDAAKKTWEYYKKAYEHFSSNWNHALLEWNLSTPVYIETEDEPVRGPKDAKHTVIIFSDFECPSCAKWEKTVQKRIVPLANKYGGIKVIYKQWPICTDCNSEAQRNLHPSACRAALAAEAAFMVGGNEAFWKMHDLLYGTQRYWRKKKSLSFRAYATRIGLDGDAFEKAFNSDEALQRVKADVLEGNNLGLREKVNNRHRDWIKVHSTPSVFVDYKRLNGLQFVKVWQTILKSPTQPKPKSLPLEMPTASTSSRQSTASK